MVWCPEKEDRMAAIGKGALRLVHYAELDSTNEEAKRLANQGEGGPLWIWAERQKAGRGRLGRVWTSLAGNLTATGLYRFDRPAGQIAQLSFAVGLAVADMADHYVKPGLARLKWPNDALIEGRKFSGTLLESGPVEGGGLWCALGVGINLSAHPARFDASGEGGSRLEATHIGAHLRPPHTAPPSPRAALDCFVDAFERWRLCWAREGFEPLRKAWLARSYGLGKSAVLYSGGHAVFEGKLETLDEQGALIIRLPQGGMTTHQAGDVIFPDPASVL